MNINSIRIVAIFIAVALIVLFSCEDNELKEPPIGFNNKIYFDTLIIKNISFRDADISCTLNKGSDVIISSQGFCYDTIANPDIEGDNITGDLNGQLQNLIPGKQYFVRAFVTFNDVTIYSAAQSIHTAALAPPILTTMEATNINATFAQSGGSVTETNGSEIISQGVCWSIKKNPTIGDNNTNDSIGSATFISILDSLQLNTTYYIRAYATNEAGIAYGNEITIKTSDGLAELITLDIEDITLNSAIAGGNIISDNGLAITARGVCWSKSSAPTIGDNKTEDGAGTGTFTSSLTNLELNTTYYIRAYSTNKAGTVYGSEKKFKTIDGLSSVTTNEISNITATLATAGGNVTSNGGVPVTSRGVCWSTSTAPTIGDNKTEDGTGTGTFTSSLTNLELNTTYYIRAYSTNGAGTVYGSEKTFKTSDGLSSVTTNEMSNITAISATAGGNVTSDGGMTVTSRGVCWSTSSAPTIGDNKTEDGTGTGTFTSSLTNLELNTTYYIRAYSINEAGTVYGSEKTFQTSDELASVTTNEISNITTISAIAGGNVTSDGGMTVTSRGVCWSTSTAPTIGDNKTEDGTGIGTFTSSLTNLELNTTYYIRAYSTNEAGTVYGSERTFKTSDGIATVTTILIGYLSETSYSVGGEVISDGGLTVSERGVCWSTTSNPDINDNIIPSGSGTGSFTVAFTGLLTGTNYYLRAYATNSTGTVYGQELQFIIDTEKPTLSTSSVILISQTSAVCGGSITENGISPVRSYGLVWDTSANPTITSNLGISTGDASSGSFTTKITGLAIGTEYYIRAWATNDKGTSYGNQLIFSTKALASDEIADIDTNIYKVVTIGEQVWMAENLSVTRYNDGNEIQFAKSNSIWTDLNTPGYCWYNKDEYGVLYNWYVVETEKICPTGWHVPTDDEWKELEMLLGMSSSDADDTSVRGEDIGTKLKSKYGWEYNGNGTDDVGFNALPGQYRSSGGYFPNNPFTGFWWTATPNTNDKSWYRYLNSNIDGISRNYESKKSGYSIRCVRDD